MRSATTLRVREGETLLTDGPFAELKEQLGGYYLLERADLDEALRWAATIPAAQSGSVEVRQVIHCGGSELSDGLDAVFHLHRWRAVANVTRLVGDLEVAEDAVQEPCAAVVVQWRTGGIPANPAAWLIGTARHKALDWQRREARRCALNGLGHT